MLPRLEKKVLAVGIVAAIALGCAEDLEGELAPGCTDTMGCPEGTRCVGGQYCEVVAESERPEPPVFEEARVPPPLTGGPTPPGLPPDSQLDGGADLFDGGPDAGRDGGPGGCVAGQAFCNGFCVDILGDRLNCGGCGIACPSTQECRQGICCNLSDVVCGAECVDLQTDPRNCGACGVDCGGGECLLGTCQPPLDDPALPPGNPPFGR